MTVISEWVFRYAAGCLIDTPDLAPPDASGAWRWAATVWPDPLAPDQWAALEWDPGERGWLLPATLAIGDVFEFGITAFDSNDRPIPECTSRWYGWLHHATDLALIVYGPYDHPQPATEAAREVINEIRLDQLDPPIEAIIEAMSAEP